MSVKWYYEDPVLAKKVEHDLQPDCTPEWHLEQAALVRLVVGPRGPEQTKITDYFSRSAKDPSLVVNKKRDVQ